MHPQYRFISFRSVNYATLHSSSIMSAALSVFSGCSFAQPSGLAPFREKRHFALNQGTPPKKGGCFLFFPRRFTLLSLHSTSLSLRSILGLAWLFDCRNTATALLKKNNFRRKSYNYFFLRCLGVFDCLSFLTTSFLKTTKEKNPVKEHPAIKKNKKKGSKDKLQVFRKTSSSPTGF